jgi:hypothetical protein
MMQLKNWVDSLQNSVVFDPTTGFIENLPNFLSVPQEVFEEDAKKAYFQECGINIRKKIQVEMISKLLKKLNLKRVIGRSNEYYGIELEQKHLEPVYKICCCLMDKTLTKEKRRCFMNQKDLPPIVKHSIFQKSFVIYASIIFLYSKNISDLSVQEMLEELELPAYELWVTF